MTEEVAFDVIGMRGDIEFRRYHRHVQASVTVEGTFEQAPNSGFVPLVRYISGENREGTKLAMTAPVMHIAESDSAHTISFVLPNETTAVPRPSRSDLTTHVVDNLVVAARRFAGGWREERARRQESDLRVELERLGVRVTGPAMFARYDPPWKPGFLRRNDVLIPVDPATIPTP